jgi:hypothetical protein
MRTALLLATIMVSVASAQTAAPLPEKLKKLQENYDAAIARATAPITATYVKELEKMKLDFTKAGDLNAALAADELIKAVSAPATPASGKTPASLADMNERQFKKWLSTVTITEIDSPFGNQYTYVNDVVTTTKAGATGPRTHPIATIEVGKLIVPFTSTTATILIDPSLTKAQVSFTTGGTFKAAITPRKE